MKRKIKQINNNNQKNKRRRLSFDDNTKVYRNGMKGMSIFSGLSGVTEGMINKGIDVIVFSELEIHARRSHYLNFKKCKLIDTENFDIIKIEDKKLIEYRGIVNMIFGGFPCQGFSTAGTRKINDVRNFLSFQFIRVINLVRPEYFMGENVKGFKSLFYNNEKTIYWISIIKKAIEEIGYTPYFTQVTMSDYNIPQKRIRIIIYGIRNDILEKRKTLSLIDKRLLPLSMYPPKIYNECCIKDIIKFSMEGAVKITVKDFDYNKLSPECFLIDMNNTETENKYINNNSCPAAKYIYDSKLYKKIINCTNKLEKENLIEKINIKYKKKYKTKKEFIQYYNKLFSFKENPSEIYFKIKPKHGFGKIHIIDITKPCNTIIANHLWRRFYILIKNKRGVFIRPFTITELQMIQTFPPNFKIYGSIREKVKQIGNAIPPKFVEQAIKYFIPLKSQEEQPYDENCNHNDGYDIINVKKLPDNFKLPKKLYKLLNLILELLLSSLHLSQISSMLCISF